MTDNKEILRRNCECLMQRIPEQKEALEAWMEEYDGGSSGTVVNRKGETVPVVRRNGRLWYLNSRYDAEAAAETFAQRYRQARPYVVYYVFGFSDGRAIRAMLSHMDESNQLLIYEPDKELFLSVMSREDCTDIITDDRVFLLLGDSEVHHLDNYIGALYMYNKKDLIEYVILPGYDVLFPEECGLYMERILYVKRHSLMQRNTAVNFKDSLTKNILSNIYEVVNGTDITRLKEAMEPYDLTGIPAIVVSAGPSLDHNIQELKKAEGRAFIIVVDAAAKAVLRAGIHFQVMLTVDSMKDLSLFEDERIYHIPLVSEPYSRIEFMRRHEARKIFSYGYGSEILKALLKGELDHEPATLRTGGSVATDAFSLAVYLGFSTIFLVGQDLAFTGDRGHVSSVCDDEQANRDHLKTRALTMVEGIDGQPIKTDLQMALYIKWFEKEIRNLEGEVNVIDATEGGARKEGAVIMTLRDAIESECRRELDFDRIIGESRDTFSDQQKADIYESMRALPEETERIYRVLEEGIACYHRLEELVKKGGIETQAFRDCMEELEQYNRLEETEKLMPLITLYAREAEYALQDDIFAKEDMTIEEIAERGAALLEGYRKAALELQRDLPLLLERLP